MLLERILGKSGKHISKDHWPSRGKLSSLPTSPQFHLRITWEFRKFIKWQDILSVDIDVIQILEKREYGTYRTHTVGINKKKMNLMKELIMFVLSTSLRLRDQEIHSNTFP